MHYQKWIVRPEPLLFSVFHFKNDRTMIVLSQRKLRYDGLQFGIIWLSVMGPDSLHNKSKYHNEMENEMCQIVLPSTWVGFAKLCVVQDVLCTHTLLCHRHPPLALEHSHWHWKCSQYRHKPLTFLLLGLPASIFLPLPCHFLYLTATVPALPFAKALRGFCVSVLSLCHLS